jgi:hypothetical protein
MKAFYLLILLFTPALLPAQINTNSHKQKDSIIRQQYKSISFSSCDSVMFGKDSLIIYYKSAAGKLIKRHFKDFMDDGTVRIEKIEYYNEAEKKEFAELWEQARSNDEESGRKFSWFIYSYERFVYDTAGRILSWIKFYPAVSRSRARKLDFTYDGLGNQSYVKTFIDIEDFWEK